MKVNVSAKLLILITTLIFIFPASIFLTLYILGNIKDDASAINAIGYIRGSIQRISVSSSPVQQEEIIQKIEEKFSFIDQGFVNTYKNNLNQYQFKSKYDDLKTYWKNLKKHRQLKFGKNNLIDYNSYWDKANEAADAAENISTKAHEKLIDIILGLGAFIFSLLIVTLYIIQKEVKNRLESTVIRDPLTQLYNRTYLIEQLNKYIKSYGRKGNAFSLIFIDVDYFKKINDTYGHTVGDRVLKEFSSLLQAELRAEDSGFRYGGEEFVILTTSTQIKQAIQLAERLRKKVESYDFGLGKPMTISMGISEYKKDEDYTSLLQHADQMLYKAKHSGRNCICVYEG